MTNYLFYVSYVTTQSRVRNKAYKKKPNLIEVKEVILVETVVTRWFRLTQKTSEKCQFVNFPASNIFSIVAQRKRSVSITNRSVDRNHLRADLTVVNTSNCGHDNPGSNHVYRFFFYVISLSFEYLSLKFFFEVSNKN